LGHPPGLTRPAPAPSGAGAHCGEAIYWRFGPGVTACLAADRLVFLDTARDRYRSLPAPLTEDVLGWLEAPGAAAPKACGRILKELGLDPAAGSPLRISLARPSPIDSEPLPAPPTRIADLLSVGRSTLSAARDVRSRRLGALLAQRLARRPAGRCPAAELKPRLAIFRAHRPLVPVRRVCLHDCLALMDWLGASGAGVSLVFGVSAYPFTAHCWLQADGQVLDDHPESPSRFAPILHFP